MKSIFELVGLPILAIILACRPPFMEATAQDTAQRAQSSEQQLIRAQQSILELKDALHKVAQELAAEKAASRVAVVKLETENAELRRRCEQMEKHLAERVQSEAEAMAALRAAQGHAAALTKEWDRMRAAQAAKPPAKPAADAQRQDDQAGRPQVVLEGEVLAVETFDLITISLGTDDGLLKEQHLELYRLVDDAATWIGRVEVIATTPNSSICKIVDQRGTIQEGDRIVPRLDTDDPFGVAPAPDTDAPSVGQPPAPDHDPFGSRPARPDAKQKRIDTKPGKSGSAGSTPAIFEILSEHSALCGY